MSKKLHLSIPKPCSADWDQMTIESKSRHCSLCSKSVHSLANYNEEEARDLLQNRVCIRAEYNQLGQVKLRNGFSTLLILGSLMGCGDNTDEVVGEAQDATSTEVLQVTAGEPDKVDLETTPVKMGKVAAPQHVEEVKMGDVEIEQVEMGEAAMEDIKEDCEEPVQKEATPNDATREESKKEENGVK